MCSAGLMAQVDRRMEAQAVRVHAIVEALSGWKTKRLETRSWDEFEVGVGMS